MVEIVLGLILAFGIYEYIKKDDVDIAKHQVVDLIDVRTTNIDEKNLQDTENYVYGDYYSNGVLQNSEVRWVTEDFLKNDWIWKFISLS